MSKEIQFEQIYHHNLKKVFAYFSACFNSNVAEDLSQTVFMKVWNSINSVMFKMPDNTNAWVFRIAVNVKNDHLRYICKNPDCAEITDKDDAVNEAENIDLSISVRRAFSMLNIKEKEVLMLKSYGFSSREIGQILNVSASTIRSRISSAKGSFKKYLEKCGVKID